MSRANLQAGIGKIVPLAIVATVLAAGYIAIYMYSGNEKEMLQVETDTGVAGVGEPVTITASVLDKAHRPADDAKVLARVKDPLRIEYSPYQNPSIILMIAGQAIFSPIARPLCF